MTYNQFIEILKARWRVIASVVGVMLLLALTINLVLPKKYTATASVLVNLNAQDPVEGYMPPANMGMGNSYMSTQIDIINSEQVARRVVRQLRLVDSPSLREQWNEATDGRGNFEAWAAKSVQRALDVRPSKDSNLININYSSVDPKFSELMANTFADVYIATTVDLKTAPAKQYNAFFDARSKELKAQLEAAQTRLTAFQREHGMVGTDERMDVETAKLNNLAATLVQAQGYTAETTGREGAAGKNPDQTPDVLGNAVIGALKTDLARQEARLNEMSAKLGDAHPELAQVRASIAETRRRIDQEVVRVSGGSRVSNNINRSRESEIRNAYEAQRQKLLLLKQDRDTAAVIIKDVEAAQRAYDTIQARLTQSSLSSQANQTNVSLLTPAVEPDKPSSPAVLLNMVAAVVLGGLLGCGAAVWRERGDPRVRTLQDLTVDMNLSVLGSMQDTKAASKVRSWLKSKKAKAPGAMANRLLVPPKRSRPALPAK
jgi:succinoglycan biosynthesis transport protein ExoP